MRPPEATQSDDRTPPATACGRLPSLAVVNLLLVRHGQSTWNAEGRWQGSADAPLSALGRRQARAASGRLGAVDVLVASDLERAVRTALLIGEELGVGPVIIEPGLRERDVGDWTGCTRAEIAERWPVELAAFQAGGTTTGDVQPPGGEALALVVDRAVSALHRVADAVGAGSDVVVISHGGVIRALERHLGRTPAPLPNLGGLRVLADDGALRLGDRVLLVDPDEVAVTVPRQL